MVETAAPGTSSQATVVSERTGTELTVTRNTTVETIGDFVTDVTLNPYIAPREISFYAYNMRPNVRLHIFFDGVNVDQYCAPALKTYGSTSNNYQLSITNTGDFESIPKGGNWGAPIYADANGIVAGRFNIPEAVFRVGERTLQIADVESLTLGGDAHTTVSSATFTASNLTVLRKTLTLTTITPEMSFGEVTDKVVGVAKAQGILDVTAYYEPLAQGLTINTPSGEAGIFATSLDIFFKQKPPATDTVNNFHPNGVEVYICEMLNGYPNGKVVLPFSRVHKGWDEINVSSNATTATKFTFEAPVFMNNNSEYAFVVKPDNNDPDYFVWTANLGDTDVSTNYQVFSQPVLGTAFYGATLNQWTALPTEYVKFVLRRANFIGTSATAVFENEDLDFLTVNNLQYVNNSVGVLPGDIVFQSTNSTVSTINSSIHGSLSYYDSVKAIIHASNSTGNFTNNSFIQIHRFPTANISTPNSSTLIAYANTSELHNPIVDAWVTQVAAITPAGTDLNITYKGISNSYAQDPYELPTNIGYETEFMDIQRIVASRTNEVNNNGGDKSITLTANLVTDSSYLSPLIDTVKYNQLVIANQVDPIQFSYNEFFNNGGSKSKYISKVITLADGQDAQDIQVILTAHRPVDTDIQVWVKFQSSADPESIDQKTWTPLINTNYDMYCNPVNTGEFKEYVYTIPKFYSMIPTTGTVTVSNTSNTVTGTSTLFDSELEVGWFINMPANSTFSEYTRKVVAIASNTSLTLNAPFNGNYSGNAYYLVPPPSTAWMARNTARKVSGTVTVSSTNNTIYGYSVSVDTTTSVNTGSDKIISTNSTYFTVGDLVYYHVPTGNTAIGGLVGNTVYYINSSNSSSVTLAQTSGGAAIDLTSNGSGTHALCKTNFTNDVRVGEFIYIAGDQQQVTGISNATHLTVNSPWTSDVSGANAYISTKTGLSYFTMSGSTYTTYKRFQIKVVLQSNVTARVPILNDLRALALQV